MTVTDVPGPCVTSRTSSLNSPCLRLSSRDNTWPNDAERRRGEGVTWRLDRRTLAATERATEGGRGQCASVPVCQCGTCPKPRPATSHPNNRCKPSFAFIPSRGISSPPPPPNPLSQKRNPLCCCVHQQYDYLAVLAGFCLSIIIILLYYY
jgi:hypothetical protein